MATTSTLRLEVGKKYRTRDNRVAEITARESSGGYPFRGQVVGSDVYRGWMESGQWGYDPGEGLDLVSEIKDEAPEYRYFRGHENSRSDKFFVIWRNAPGDRLVEGWLPNIQGDEWTETDLSLTDDLLSDPNIIECDADGLILGRPDPAAPESACDLTAAQRTRIAKLAARIVLADGPCLTADGLAAMTIGELVTRLEPVLETEHAIYL